MEDLNSTLNSILSDPSKMEQLRQVAQSLGLNPGGAPTQGAPSSGPPDVNALAGLLQNFQNGGAGAAAPPPSPPQPVQQAAPQAAPAQQAAPRQGGANSLAAFAKISEIMATYNQSDKNVELLRSLKPHFSPTRAGRIDDAVRIMQLIRAWPALRDSGLLGGLGNLFGGGDKK